MVWNQLWLAVYSHIRNGGARQKSFLHLLYFTLIDTVDLMVLVFLFLVLREVHLLPEKGNLVLHISKRLWIGSLYGHGLARWDLRQISATLGQKSMPTNIASRLAQKAGSNISQAF